MYLEFTILNTVHITNAQPALQTPSVDIYFCVRLLFCVPFAGIVLGVSSGLTTRILSHKVVWEGPLSILQGFTDQSG